MKKIILIMSIILIGIVLLTGCANDEKESITVMLDWTPNTNHTGLYVALKNGYYDDLGLKVEIIQSSEGSTVQYIAAGKAEFGISFQEEVTYARANQIPIVSIATIIQHNTSGFASPVDRNIKSPKDFEGKTYGGWGPAIEKAVIQTVMELDDGDFSKVTTVNAGVADFFTATKKDIDFEWIYYGWTGIEAELREYAINYIELRDLSPQLDYYTPVIITNEAYINDSPEIIKKFIGATAKGYEYAIQNPEDAAEILISSVSGMDKELVLKSQLWISKKYKDDAKVWGVQKEVIWDTFSKWMFDYELIPEMINVEDAYTNEFLPN